MTTDTETRPTCPKCGSANVYVKKGGAVYCRRCGATDGVAVEGQSSSSAS